MSCWPILTFHSVDASGTVISIAPGQLELLLRSLAESGWRGCTISEALESWRRRPGERCCALSFDDGYRNVATEGLAILREFDFSATVFAITGRVGADNDWPGQPDWVPRLPLLGWNDLEHLAAAGWEVASHGREHLPLTLLDADAAERDLEGAAADIEGAIGRRPELVAYPYGACDARIRTIVRRHHRGAVGVRLQAVQARDLADPFALPRIDAYYLRGRDAHRLLDGTAGAAYLALRRWARRLRRSDWDPAAFADRIPSTVA